MSPLSPPWPEHPWGRDTAPLTSPSFFRRANRQFSTQKVKASPALVRGVSPLGSPPWVAFHGCSCQLEGETVGWGLRGRWPCPHASPVPRVPRALTALQRQHREHPFPRPKFTPNGSIGPQKASRGGGIGMGTGGGGQLVALAMVSPHGCPSPGFEGVEQRGCGCPPPPRPAVGPVGATWG